MNPVRKTFFPKWLHEREGESGIVISTRIRLARNLSHTRFPSLASQAEKDGILQQSQTFTYSPSTFRMQFQFIRDLSEVYRGVLAERGLINLRSLTATQDIGLAIGPEQIVSLLVNEEDHFRIQVLLNGLQLQSALGLAAVFDQELGKAFPLAFHPRFGYLTVCPTNVGTGLRASVMLHLPALVLTQEITQVLHSVLQMGLALRGFYGEGTELKSVFFQISNQITLGRSEAEIIHHLAGIIQQIVEKEKQARNTLLTSQRDVLEDRLGRALGLLSGCRRLSFEEALELLSTIRLGIETGWLAQKRKISWNQLLLLIQPAHLQLLAGQDLSLEEQNARRAQMLQKRLRLHVLEIK